MRWMTPLLSIFQDCLHAWSVLNESYSLRSGKSGCYTQHLSLHLNPRLTSAIVVLGKSVSFETHKTCVTLVDHLASFISLFESLFLHHKWKGGLFLVLTMKVPSEICILRTKHDTEHTVDSPQISTHLFAQSCAFPPLNYVIRYLWRIY